MIVLSNFQSLLKITRFLLVKEYRTNIFKLQGRHGYRFKKVSNPDLHINVDCAPPEMVSMSSYKTVCRLHFSCYEQKSVLISVINSKIIYPLFYLLFRGVNTRAMLSAVWYDICFCFFRSHKMRRGPLRITTCSLLRRDSVNCNLFYR